MEEVHIHSYERMEEVHIHSCGEWKKSKFTALGEPNLIVFDYETKHSGPVCSEQECISVTCKVSSSNTESISQINAT